MFTKITLRKPEKSNVWILTKLTDNEEEDNANTRTSTSFTLTDEELKRLKELINEST